MNNRRARLLLLSAVGHLLRGESDAAIRDLCRAIGLQEDFEQAYFWLASTLLGQGRYREAVMVADMAIAVVPDGQALRATLILALRKLGDAERAERECYELIRRQPEDLDVCYHLAVLAAERGGPQATMDYLVKANGNRPRNGRAGCAYLEVGLAMVKTGHPEVAQAVWTEMQYIGGGFRTGGALSIWRSSGCSS